MPPQTYLVTGASRGIGRALSVELAKQGVRVLLLARPSDALGVALSSVQEHSPESCAVPCDLADMSSIADAAASILESAPVLDGIVHNAGAIAPVQPILAVDGSAWARSIQVNLVGVQHLTQLLASAMVGDHRVRVTTISSGASLRPLPSWSAYCVAKAGQDMWARCLAEEGRDLGISAISVAPGIVDTGMQADIRATTVDDFPLRDTFVHYHASGQLSRAEDVAVQLLDLVLHHTMEQSGERFDVRDLP
jgi:benzil reductase ((S)-benzoin forming)